MATTAFKSANLSFFVYSILVKLKCLSYDNDNDTVSDTFCHNGTVSDTFSHTYEVCTMYCPICLYLTRTSSKKQI